MSYIGQTDSSLKQRYSEHVRYIRQNNSQSVYNLHTLQNLREFVPISDTVSLVQQANKSRHMNVIEQYHVQEHKHNKNLISEQNPGEHKSFLIPVRSAIMSQNHLMVHLFLLSHSVPLCQQTNNTEVYYRQPESHLSQNIFTYTTLLYIINV